MRAAVYGRQSSNKAKSIAEQIRAGHAVTSENGWDDAGEYKDGRSASRFGTKQRNDWQRLLTDVKAANLDVLILWESSRGDRTLSSWSTFLEDCRDHSVRIYVITHERLYDLRNPRDWKTLAEDGVSNAYESELLSIRTRRGHAGAAAAGLPPGGPVPFGYRRVFNPDTGVREGWVPDETTAGQVSELFRRVGKGDPLLRIANDMGLTTNAVRRIARNPLYLGIRTHNGVEHRGNWEPLVTAAAFRDARQVLGDPARRITRPGRQKHLLTYLACCDVCDAPIEQAVGYYRCTRKRCVSAPLRDIDHALRRVMLGLLAQPDSLQAMATTDDTEANRWQAEADRLRGQAKEWEAIAGRGKDSPARVAAILLDLEDRIQQADRAARAARLPAAVRDLLDDPDGDAAQWWDDATVVARRQLVKAVAEVRISRGIPGRSSTIQRRDRAVHRLGRSRWAGSDRTWADLWGGP